jgi:ABC-type antimicrobial peptide transport system permease subunit
VKLNIYASDATYCNEYKVSTRLVQIPYYNKYYKNDLCNGYEYYYLCKENSDVRLTDEQFEKNMKAYIDSLKKTNEEESNNNLQSNKKFDIVAFIVEYNVYISGFGGILLVIYITYMIKKMNKERGVL